MTPNEREALELALEVLEELNNTNSYWLQEVDEQTIKKINPSIAAIKEALEQPVSSHGNAEDLYLEMSKHLNCPHCGGSGHIDDVAQPEQEPFCYVNVNAQGDVTRTVKRKDAWCRTPLYTTPPQQSASARTWVGLTDEEQKKIADLASANDWHDFDVMDATEAKLKEKNT